MRKISPFALLLMFVAPPAFCYQAEVVHIPAKNYFQTVKKEMDRAQHSIAVYMYVFSLLPDQPKSLAYQLAQTLKKAQDRGVKVEVILDQNIDFTNGPTAAWTIKGKNLAAYDFLKNQNIPVYFDDATTYTHAKAVIIDGKTVITGSTNWSKAGMTRNVETNVLIRSTKLAQEILNELKTIKKQSSQLEHESDTVLLPNLFLTRPNLLGRMVSRHDERAFDIYLYLLKEQAARNNSTFQLNFKALAASLYIANTTQESYRRQINKVLSKLEGRYKLIRVKKAFAKPTTIHLIDLEHTDKIYRPPQDKAFSVPETFWTYGWNHRLTFPGKAFYLLHLSESADSPTRPRWSLSGKTLAHRTHVSRSFISNGVTALRRANLLEVDYDVLTMNASEPRRPAIYTPNPLYDPRELDKTFIEMEGKYGTKAVKKAKKYAALVYEDSDVKAIERLINLEKKYGRDKIRQALKILGAKNPDNPKRTMGYLINTIKNLK